jgi:dihydrofolate synthase/folylpolyglutamate synthase
VSAVPYVPPVSPGSTEYLSTAAERRPSAAHGASRGLGTNSELVPAGRQNHLAAPISRYPLQVMGTQIVVETPLVGRHQLRNLALAIAAAEELGTQGFPISPQTIERGIRETRWPGRFQVIPPSVHAFEYVFDVAHNPAGAWALRSTLSAGYEGRPLTFVFGAMRDKAIGEMAEILFPLAERIILTRADNPRSATPAEIRAAALRVAAYIEEAGDVASAIERANSLARPRGVVVITGSIYIVGEAMRVLGVKV